MLSSKNSTYSIYIKSSYSYSRDCSIIIFFFSLIFFLRCLSFPRFLRRIDLVHGQILNAEKRTFSFIYCALSDLSISQHSLVRRLNFALLPFPGPQVNIGGLLFPRPSAPQRCRRVCRLQPRSPPQGEREKIICSVKERKTEIQ